MVKMRRSDWIRQMWTGGHRGRIDFFKRASEVIPYSGTDALN